MATGPAEEPPAADASDVSRAVREFTAFLRRLDARDLRTAERAALRSLFDELRAMMRGADDEHGSPPRASPD